MDMLRTDRTYKTRENAVGFLERQLAKLGLNLEQVDYFIAVNDQGRFAPAVRLGERHRAQINALMFDGVTIFN